MKKSLIYLLCAILLFNTLILNNNIHVHASAPLVVGEAILGESIENALIGIACTVLGVELTDTTVFDGAIFGKVEQVYKAMPEERRGLMKERFSRGAKVGSDGNFELDSQALEVIQDLLNDFINKFNDDNASSGGVPTDLQAYYYPVWTPNVAGNNYLACDCFCFNGANSTYIFPLENQYHVPVTGRESWGNLVSEFYSDYSFNINGTNVYYYRVTNAYANGRYPSGCIDVSSQQETQAIIDLICSYFVDGFTDVPSVPIVTLPTETTIYNPDIIPNIQTDVSNPVLTIPQYFEIVNNYYNDEYVTNIEGDTYTIADTVNPSITDDIENPQKIDTTLPLTPTIAIPSGVKTVKGLQTIFPFCIPFDIVAFFQKFDVQAETPIFTYKLYVENIVDYDIVIDFTMFNTLFALLRKGLLILFIVGLIMLTKPLINPER